ncbi:MAG: hypothetical protein ACTSQJ_00675 [Promethearchaeota archaeon]
MIKISELNWGFLEILFLIIVFAIGFIVTYFLLPYIIKIMKQKGFVGLDIHKNSKLEVAESGGLSIMGGISIACLALMLFFPYFIPEILIFLVTIILAGIIGFIDDRMKLRTRYKMSMVLIAGSVIFIANYFGYIHIESPTIPFLGKLRLTIIYPLVIPIIIAVFANTTNMLEGYNGEGSGTCLIAALFLLICAFIWNSALGLIFCLVAIAVLIPFFLFNKYPAKVFPGDTGTLIMGAMLGCIALFGHLEVAVFCALLIHIFNSFYVLTSVRGFFESSEIQESKNDIILLDDDRIKASDQKDAALTLPRLILAKGPLTEPELVKNFYVISVICGFFSIIATLFLLYSIGDLDLIVIIVVILFLLFPTIFLLYKFPRIRGIIILMIILLSFGIIFLIFIDIIIMPVEETIKIPIINIKLPLNIIYSFLIAAPGFAVWYFITIKYFWREIDKMKEVKHV